MVLRLSLENKAQSGWNGLPERSAERYRCASQLAIRLRTWISRDARRMRQLLEVLQPVT